MERLLDWTVINNNYKSYLIGSRMNGRELRTSNIQQILYLYNDFMIIETKNTKYKLYFSEQFEPTHRNTMLLNWYFERNNKKVSNINAYNVFDKKLLGTRIVGKKLLSSQIREWVSTPIVNITYYSDFLELITESGSSYYIYWYDQEKKI
tara:strand:+ start:544 stop:993 length:450 start_codon:yes stop_codon:yes gene_type:complete